MKAVNKRVKDYNNYFKNNDISKVKQEQLNKGTRYASTLFVISGFLLIGFNIGWLAACGVYMMLLGNNLGDISIEKDLK